MHLRVPFCTKRCGLLAGARKMSHNADMVMALMTSAARQPPTTDRKIGPMRCQTFLSGKLHIQRVESRDQGHLIRERL